jgi:hypothetical protein
MGTRAPREVVVSARPTEDGRADQPCRPQGRAGGESERERQRPAAKGQDARPAAQLAEVDLETSEEEERREAELGQRVHEVVHAGEVEELRADEDPENDLGEDHRHPDAPGEVDEDRGQGRGRDHDEQVRGIDVHGGGSLGGAARLDRPQAERRPAEQLFMADAERLRA